MATATAAATVLSASAIPTAVSTATTALDAVTATTAAAHRECCQARDTYGDTLALFPVHWLVAWLALGKHSHMLDLHSHRRASRLCDAGDDRQSDALVTETA